MVLIIERKINKLYKLLFILFLVIIVSIYLNKFITFDRNKHKILMFITKISPHFSKQIQIALMQIDPERKKIAFLRDNKNQIVITTVLVILEYVLEWKKQFNLKGRYSSVKQVDYQYCIKLKSTINPHLLQFSKKISGTQLLAVAYLSGLIQIYNIQNQKIIKCIQTKNCCLKLYFQQMDLYVTMYNLTLLKCTANSNTQIMHKSAIFDCFNNQQIYQDKNYNLCKGQEIVIPSQYDICENSYEQFLNLQILGKQWNPIVYQISQCGQFFIKRTISGQFEIFSIQKQVKLIEKIHKYPYFSPFQYGTLKCSIFAYIENDNHIIIKLLNNGIAAQFKDLKYVVEDIIWIGPYQLLLLLQNESIYFLQIFNNYLQSFVQSFATKEAIKQHRQ